MALGVVLSENQVFVTKEITEGVYVAESVAAEAIEVVSDEFTPAKALISRDNKTSSIETVAPRSSTKSISGSLEVEFKSGSAEGDAPETDVMWESLFGGKRQQTTVVTSAITHTSTLINLVDGDGAKFAVGDSVLVKEAGAFEVRPVSAVVTTASSNSITFPFALDNGAPTNNVVVSKLTTYFHQTGAPTMSITRYIGGVVRQKSVGTRSISAELSGFETGQLAKFGFALEGLTYGPREAGTSPLVTGTFDTSQPAVILNACIFIDGLVIDANALGLSITNEKANLTSTCSSNGNIASRFTRFSITGSVNPYLEDDDVAQWSKFDSNTTFSIFASVGNPTGVTGEIDEVTAIYLPNCKMTEFATGDQEGVATDEIAFSCFRNLGNDIGFISFI